MAKQFNQLKQGLDLDDRLTFGKYQGAELRSLIIIDPSYVTWLLEHVDTFVLSDSATKYFKNVPKPLVQSAVSYALAYQGVYDKMGINHDEIDDIPF